MFNVSGENAELQFDVKEGVAGASFTVSGKISDEESASVGGSIVSVGTGAAFGMDAGVTLKENNSAANGGAITNVGGNIVLKGGTITGNNGAKGAVYSDSDIKVQGTVVVKENQPANIYLAGTSALVVSGAMTNSDISFTQEKAADKQVAVKSVENFAAADFNTAVGQIKYDTTDYTLALAENGLSATLQKKAAEATATPTPTPAQTVKPKTPAVTVTAGKKQATLKWKKVSGAKGYVVYRATSKSGKYKAVSTIKKGSTVSYINKKLTSKKTYYYKVRAYRTENGKRIYSSYSKAKSAKIK